MGVGELVVSVSMIFAIGAAAVSEPASERISLANRDTRSREPGVGVVSGLSDGVISDCEAGPLATIRVSSREEGGVSVNPEGCSRIGSTVGSTDGAMVGAIGSEIGFDVLSSRGAAFRTVSVGGSPEFGVAGEDDGLLTSTGVTVESALRCAKVREGVFVAEGRLEMGVEPVFVVRALRAMVPGAGPAFVIFGISAEELVGVFMGALSTRGDKL